MKLAKGGTKEIPLSSSSSFLFFWLYCKHSQKNEPELQWKDFKPNPGKSESPRRAVKFLSEQQGFYWLVTFYFVCHYWWSCTFKCRLVYVCTFHSTHGFSQILRASPWGSEKKCSHPFPALRPWGLSEAAGSHRGDSAPSGAKGKHVASAYQPGHRGERLTVRRWALHRALIIEPFLPPG